MRHFKLTLAYNGSNYSGWQVQPNDPSIQASIEHAISGVTGQDVRATASGRTDAGVHALGQVASFRVETKLTTETMHRALNAHLPDDIRILSTSEVNDSFHPIADAIKKRYRYRIQYGEQHDVFSRGTSWFVPGRLDLAAMRQAAGDLAGEHDFAAFQAAGSDRKTSIRTIYDSTWHVERESNLPIVAYEVEANGFLYNMVRNIVGTLVEIGLARRPRHAIPEILSSLDRNQAGVTAPPEGLFLVNVTYPTER